MLKGTVRTGHFSMPSQQNLERLPLEELAVLCKQVADNPKEYTDAAEAYKLTRQWFKLKQPPRPSLREQQEMERDQAELKKRMVEFLALGLLAAFCGAFFRQNACDAECLQLSFWAAWRVPL